jgi:hypothetical protein
MHVRYHSVFAANPTGHGGNRRLAQWLELLRRGGVEVDFHHDRFGGNTADNARQVARGVAAGLQPGTPMQRRALRHLRAWRNVGALQHLDDAVQRDGTGIWLFDSYLRAYEPWFDGIRQRGGKLVLLPHNLDALVPGITDPMGDRTGLDWLKEEVALLAKGDLVCCISREEQWLLAACGVPAAYLPYFPPRDVAAALADIRRRREAGTARSVVLILGTASNPPTLAGMRALAGRAQSILERCPDCEVRVVGFGTEVLREMPAPVRWRVLGAIPDDTLHATLIETRVALCHQLGTSGALTRITELLLAGVPVIANPIAARSSHGAEGLTVVEDLDELVDALGSAPPSSFEPPQPPLHLERRFLETLSAL